MPKKYKINVTQRDIDNWLKFKTSSDVCAECAVAKAVRRHKGLESARVSLSSMSINKGTTCIALPAHVSEFILTIDGARHCIFETKPKPKPFSFTITI
jgi:hypothetical protein